MTQNNKELQTAYTKGAGLGIVLGAVGMKAGQWIVKKWKDYKAEKETENIEDSSYSEGTEEFHESVEEKSEETTDDHPAPDNILPIARKRVRDRAYFTETSQKIMQKAMNQVMSIRAFNPVAEYPLSGAMGTIDPDALDKEVANVEQLIVEMNERGAPIGEIVNVIKYYLVLEKTEQYEFDYAKACQDFHVPEMWEKYHPKGA